MSNNLFDKTFAKRSAISLILIFLAFLICLLRITVIASSDYAERCENQITYKIPVCRLRGSIMDCNMLPITNSETEIYAACLPTSSAKAIIPTLLEGKEKERVTGILADNGCAVCVVPYEVDCDGVTYIKLPKRVGENTLAHHIIGCVNSEMSGTSGLEYAYNDIKFFLRLQIP